MKKRKYLLRRLLRILVMSSSYGVFGAEAPVDINFRFTLMNGTNLSDLTQSCSCHDPWGDYIDHCSLFLGHSHNDH